MSFSTMTTHANKLYRDVCTLKDVASVVFPKKDDLAPTQRQLKLVVQVALAEYPTFGSLIKTIADMHPLGSSKMPGASSNHSMASESRIQDYQSLVASSSGIPVGPTVPRTGTGMCQDPETEMDLGDFSLQELEFPDDPVYVPRAPTSLSHSPPAAAGASQSCHDRYFSCEVNPNNCSVMTQDLASIQLPALLLEEQLESIPLCGSDEQVSKIKPWLPLPAAPASSHKPGNKHVSLPPGKSILKSSSKFGRSHVYDGLSKWLLPLLSLVLLVAGPVACFLTLGWIHLAFPLSNRDALEILTTSRKNVRFEFKPKIANISGPAVLAPSPACVGPSVPAIILAPAYDGSKREEIIYCGPTAAPASLSGQSQKTNVVSGRKRRNAVSQGSRMDIKSIPSLASSAAAPLFPPVSVSTVALPRTPRILVNTNRPSDGHNRPGSDMGEWLQQLATSQGLKVDIPSAEREKLARVLNTPPSSPDSTPPSTPTLSSSFFIPNPTNPKPYSLMEVAMSRLRGSRNSL
ncbi:hypothetical protein RhiJN_18263 [Ceratobasidium sp. AG-Ba]|nr:hypothetical protein RhiJN_18263 [Ceratobasidium sp. AG-Ba]